MQVAEKISLGLEPVLKRAFCTGTKSEIFFLTAMENSLLLLPNIEINVSGTEY